MLEQIQIDLEAVEKEKEEISSMKNQAFALYDNLQEQLSILEKKIFQIQEGELKILEKEAKLLATKEILGGYEAQEIIDVEEAVE